MILGIVGGIGAGKSTIVTLIAEQTPCQVIGADEIGHKILLKGGLAYNKVIDTFGKCILDDQGHIVRQELGKIVFSDPAQLRKLNRISHPIILEETQNLINKHKSEGATCIVIDAALLIEIGLINLVDCVLGVYTDEEIRIQRIMKREGFSKEEALARISKQKKWEELEKVIDYTINNNGEYSKTVEQIKFILHTLNVL